MNEKRKIVLFIATSLDGFIATKDDSLDWLYKVDGNGDNGYSKFYETVDTVVMGRRTYDWLMKNVEGDFPYQNRECYVFSRFIDKDTKDVKFVNEDLVKFIKKLNKQEGKNIWVVGGGGLLHSFLNEGLVDELILTIAPTLLGNGIPLFNENDFQIELSLKDSKRFNQFIELYYIVKS